MRSTLRSQIGILKIECSPLTYLSFCVFVCMTRVYISTCVNVGLHAHNMHVEIKEQYWVPALAFHLVGDRVSLFASALCQASWPTSFLCLYPLSYCRSTGVSGVWHHMQPYMGSGDPNPDPLGCIKQGLYPLSHLLSPILAH